MIYEEITKPTFPTMKWDDPGTFWDEEDVQWDERDYVDIDKPIGRYFFDATFYPFLHPSPFKLASYEEITKPTL